MASALYPLRVNLKTQEPYLRLLPPHEHIIMTPARPSDASAIPPIFNDVRVYMTIANPPYPHTEAHAAAWVQRVIKESNNVMDALKAGETESGGGIRLAEGCPVNILREVKADGSEIFLGDLGIYKARWSEVLDTAARQKLVADNEARALGDPETVWEFRDYLAPSHHGQGIMSTAVKTLLAKWAIPRMGVSRMHLTVFKGNIASVRVFEKNGFTVVGTVEADCVEVQETKGGGRAGLHVLDWTAP